MDPTDDVDIRFRGRHFYNDMTLMATQRIARQLKEDGYPEVYWIYGESGSGKTTLAINMAKCLGDEYFILSAYGTACWWDGYRQEDVVIIDDVDVSWLSLDLLKAYLDRRRESRVPVKGGTLYLTAKHVILTAVNAPLDVYKSAELQRRVRHVFRRGGEAEHFQPGL